MFLGHGVIRRFIFIRNILAAAFCLGLSIVAVSSPAQANPQVEATNLVRRLLTESASLPSLTGQERIQRIRDLAPQFIAIDEIGLWVLGANRRAFTQQDLNQYREVFREYLVHWLAEKMNADFARVRFQVGELIWLGGEDREVMVKLQPTNGSVDGSIFVRQLPNARGEVRPIIFNLMFLGQSMILSYRTQYGDQFNRLGRTPGALIQYIRGQTQLLAQNITAPTQQPRR